MARGDDLAAIAQLEPVVARLQAERSPHLVRALSRLALAQQRAGRPAEASATARRAVEVARSAMAGLTTSEFLGSALLAEARILSSQGDAARAQALLAEAREQLAGSIGQDAPALRQAQLQR
jgi:hypothetical protein